MSVRQRHANALLQSDSTSSTISRTECRISPHHILVCAIDKPNTKHPQRSTRKYLTHAAFALLNAISGNAMQTIPDCAPRAPTKSPTLVRTAKPQKVSERKAQNIMWAFILLHPSTPSRALAAPTEPRRPQYVPAPSPSSVRNRQSRSRWGERHLFCALFSWRRCSSSAQCPPSRAQMSEGIRTRFPSGLGP